MQGDPAALALTEELRQRLPRLLGVEFIDAACLKMLREDGVDGRLKIDLSTDSGAAIYFELETERPLGSEDLAAGNRELHDILQLLCRFSELEKIHLAFTDDPNRRDQLAQLREAVPHAVYDRLIRRRVDDNGIHKLAADPIVPVDRLSEFLTGCREAFERHGLEGAIWGHLADGNLHPNVLARNGAEMEQGKQLLLELAALAQQLGGAPLAEHGVGRNPLKQEMLRRFVGSAGIERMWQVKRALDPDLSLAPGVLLPQLV